jgi:enoyl-CoA hydratase/carnithine racemase
MTSIAPETIGGLSLQVEAGIASLTMRYPPLNLLGGDVFTDLSRMLPRIAADAAIRVLILQSGIPGVFCQHGDVSQMTGMDAAAAGQMPEMSGAIQGILGIFSTMPPITIAKIAGLCRGGGQELALALDMRFAATEISRFGQPEVAMGIIPGAGGTTRLTRMLGGAKALEVLVGSDDLTAEDAERIGFINRALPPADLDDHVARLARRIADQPAHAVAAAKKAIYANLPKLDFTAEVEGLTATLTHPGTQHLLDGMLEAGLQRSLADELNMDALTARGREIAATVFQAESEGSQLIAGWRAIRAAADRWGVGMVRIADHEHLMQNRAHAWALGFVRLGSARSAAGSRRDFTAIRQPGARLGGCGLGRLARKVRRDLGHDGIGAEKMHDDARWLRRGVLAGLSTTGDSAKQGGGEN